MDVNCLRQYAVDCDSWALGAAFGFLSFFNSCHEGCNCKEQNTEWRAAESNTTNYHNHIYQLGASVIFIFLLFRSKGRCILMHVKLRYPQGCENFSFTIIKTFLNVHREVLLRTAAKINYGWDFLLYKNLASLENFQEMGRSHQHLNKIDKITSVTGLVAWTPPLDKMIETDMGGNQTAMLAQLMPISMVLWKAGCLLYFLLSWIGGAKWDSLCLHSCVKWSLYAMWIYWSNICADSRYEVKLCQCIEK